MQSVFDELYENSLAKCEFKNLISIITAEENIRLAYRNLKKNAGSRTPGTDGKTIADLAKMSEPELIGFVQQKFNWYQPQSVRRKEIPKGNGKTRPLGIPTIMDRLIQQCVLQVMEPICEAKFCETSNGFRPNRGVENALAQAEKHMQKSNLHIVIDIDIKGFFDNVNHGKLLRQIWAMGIHDKKLLSIISAMLKAEVAGIGFPEKGTPQGGILSPLLSNIVLNELDWWITSQWVGMPTRHEYSGKIHENGTKDQSKKYRELRKTNLKECYIVRAIPHKERTAKRSGKRYNKEVKKQLTMSLISDELGQASTKKKEFLGIMEKLIPWSQWVGIVQPHYYKGERGNKPYDLELMLRIYVLQHLYNLADDAARNEIIDSRAFSQFCGVDSSNQVPDGDTIGRFRHILERNQLGEAFFTNVVESLQKCNLMLKKGTIVDSTLIAAPSSTKNKEKQRDPEAHSVKKGNQWYFGYKEHIGVDADSGLVHTVETTSANVHDSNMVAELLQGTEEEIYGDSGYLGAEKRDDAVLVNNEGKPIRYQINKRPSQLKKANGEKFELLKAIEHAKSSVRSKVEHVFCVIKRIFHFCKTRYRGRKKLHQHCCTLFALANLYLARNRMKVA